jgi:predicted DNA-binding protein with PD1-like motif
LVIRLFLWDSKLILSKHVVLSLLKGQVVGGDLLRMECFLFLEVVTLRNNRDLPEFT